jgi:predicted ATPase
MPERNSNSASSSCTNAARNADSSRPATAQQQVGEFAADRGTYLRELLASLLSIPAGDRYPALALSAAQQRRLTLAALLDQLEALARQKPVLMLFEDAHWADATSLEVLDLTVERVRALPVLMLITFRPEYEAPWTGLSHVTSIALLALAEVEILAEHVAGRPLPPR